MFAKTHLQATNSIRIEIMLDMTMGELRDVAAALDKGKVSYHGGAYQLLKMLRDTSERVNRGFEVHSAAGTPVAGDE